MPDGTPVFRNEPFITVRGNKIETKIVETALLAIYNSQIAYATAARKIVESANGIDVVVEDATDKAESVTEANEEKNTQE